MTTDLHLAPCPFCGSPGHVPNYGGSDIGYYATCTSVDCFVSVGENYDRDAMPEHVFSTPEEAAKAWNRRVN